MWTTYMASPWTRDGTARAYVVRMAPEVAGRIVQLPVSDNQFVNKGDLLMVIDPKNYGIAVDLAEAAAKQTQVNAEKHRARSPATAGADDACRCCRTEANLREQRNCYAKSARWFDASI